MYGVINFKQIVENIQKHSSNNLSEIKATLLYNSHPQTEGLNQVNHETSS